MKHWRLRDEDKKETENKSTCHCCHGNRDGVWDFDNRTGEGAKSGTVSGDKGCATAQECYTLVIIANRIKQKKLYFILYHIIFWVWLLPTDSREWTT